MVSAATVQALLLGSGGFLGTCMAGVGAFRLFSAATHGILRVPASLEKGAELGELTLEELRAFSPVFAEDFFAAAFFAAGFVTPFDATTLGVVTLLMANFASCAASSFSI